MADLSLIRMSDLDDAPVDAKKKWLECQIQEAKSVLFKLKQQLDLCEQEIDDIRNGKMKKIQYSMIMTTEKIKSLSQELNTVSIQ